MPVPAVDLTDTEFTIPGDGSSGLYVEVTRLANTDLTTGVIGGSGAFDALMAGVAAHLRGEYDASRITGAEYTKAYIALVQAAMAGATQFLLARENTYWQAVQAQIGAVTAKVNHETAKVGYDTARYQLDTVLPLQSAKLTAETANLTYTLTYLLPKQVYLISEQGEAQRAQTWDYRSDGGLVVGSIGKQKDLYNQQITSYRRDIEIKGAKLFSDAWITMKTLDEGLAAPANFSNDSLNNVLQSIKTNIPVGW
jgi:hypothetical protein